MTAPTDPSTDSPTDTPTQSSLDLVDVETVRENGIIETPTAYAMLVDVQPRDWLTLSEEQRSSLYTNFLTYLRGVDFPTQFHTMTTRFDADQYYDHHVGAEAPTADVDVHPFDATASTPTQDVSDQQNEDGPTDAPTTATHATETVPEDDDILPTADEPETHAAGADTPADDAHAADYITFPAELTADDGHSGDSESTDVGEAPPKTVREDVPAPDGGTTTGDDNLIVESALLEYGRHAHVNWLSSIVSDGNVRDRRFVIAVGVSKAESESDGDGEGEATRDGVFGAHLPLDSLPGIGPTPTVTNETPYLDEVWTRAQHIASKLPRTGVNTDVLDTRSEVLAFLYRYYHGEKAPISFDHGALTGPDMTTVAPADTDADETPTTAAGDADSQAMATGSDADADADPHPDTDTDTDTEPDCTEYPDRPVTDSPAAPFDGRVKPEYVDTVNDSRVLSWYARHVGRIGTGTHDRTPRAVYAGVCLFGLSLLLAAVGLGAFLASTRPAFVAPDSATGWLVREMSYGLAAASLPLFLCSLVGLLPTGRRGRVAGLAGTGVAGAAVVRFSMVYPAQWTANMALTDRIVTLYAAGIGALVVAVGVAVAARRTALADVTDGQAPTETAEAQAVNAPSDTPTNQQRHTD